MRMPIRWHWHRFWEWLDGRLAAGLWTWGNHHQDQSLAHGREADRIDAEREINRAREWDPRRWDRGEDPRSDTRERRP